MRSWWLLAGTAAVAVACGSSEGDGDTAASGTDASGAGAGSGSGGDGDGDGVGGSFTTSVGSGASSSGSGGSAEVCDGIDNDNNGVVDDVDKGGDGICDCLRIATLGVPGQWGVGDVFATWLSERSDNGSVSLGDQVLTPALLGQYQVIVAENVSTIGRTYAADEVAALQAWVEGGGGFMTLIGYGDPSERTNANTLLSPFGVQYQEQQILQKSGGSTVPVMGWNAHPVSMGVSRIGVDNGYEVSGGGTLVADEQGYDMLRAVEQGSGHVLVWGDEWITYDSEWTEHPDYQVELFWLNSIKWLTPEMDCQVPVPEPK